MTDSERTDDSGRLQIPFPPDDPEAPESGTAPAPGTASGRSRLSDRRPSDPDAGPAGARAPRLTGARHRPGHAIGRAAGAATRSAAVEGGSDPSNETVVPPSNGATASPTVAGRNEAAAKDPGGSGLTAGPPATTAPPGSPATTAGPPATTAAPGSPTTPAGPPDTPVAAVEPGPSFHGAEAAFGGAALVPVPAADAPVTRLGATGAWATAAAGRLQQVRLPKLTRTPGPGDNAEGADFAASAAPAMAETVRPDSTRAVSPPVTRPAPSGVRRPSRRPDMGGLTDMRVKTKSGRMPDWMARRIAEFEAPGAAYELGKQRRLRRRKITVLRSRTDRRLVRRIDTWTVFKVSFMFYLLMVIIVLIAGIVTWNVAEHLGFIGDIQKSVRSLADDKSFVFHGRVALRWAAIGGAALGLLGTLFNTVAAMLYNLLSDVIGGLQVVVVTEAD
jgi:hypothetical protein